MGALQEGCRSSFGLDVRLLRFQNRSDSEEPTMLSNDLLSAGRIHDALRVAAIALNTEQDDAELWVAYGCSWRARSESSETREEDLSRAQGCFINAARFAPDWMDTWRLLAEVLLDREQHRRAADVACRALAHGSTDLKLRQIYEQARMVADLLDRVSSYEENPDSEDPAMLAQVLLATGRIEQADQVTAKAIEDDGDDIDLLAVRARVLRECGDLEGAIAAFERSTLLDPDWREGWNELQSLYLDVGDEKSARRAARESVRVAARAARRDTYIPPARKENDAPAKISQRVKLDEAADAATTMRLEKAVKPAPVDPEATLKRIDPAATLRRTESKPVKADSTWKSDAVVDDVSLTSQLMQSSWEKAKSEPGFSLDIMVEEVAVSSDVSSEGLSNEEEPPALLVQSKPTVSLPLSAEDSGLHLLESDDDILDQLASELLAEGLTTSPTSPGWDAASPWTHESSAGGLPAESVPAESIDNTRDITKVLRFEQPEAPLELDIEIDIEMPEEIACDEATKAEELITASADEAFAIETKVESSTAKDSEVEPQLKAAEVANGDQSKVETKAPASNFVTPSKVPDANSTWRLGGNSHKASKAAITKVLPKPVGQTSAEVSKVDSLTKPLTPSVSTTTSKKNEELPEGVGDARALRMMQQQLLAERSATVPTQMEMFADSSTEDLANSSENDSVKTLDREEEISAEMRDDANISQSEASHLYAVTDTNPIQETFERVAQVIAAGEVDFVRIKASKEKSEPGTIEVEFLEEVAVGKEVVANSSTKAETPNTKPVVEVAAMDPFEAIATILEDAAEEEVLLESVFGTQSGDLMAVDSDSVTSSSAFGNIEAEPDLVVSPSAHVKTKKAPITTAAVVESMELPVEVKADKLDAIAAAALEVQQELAKVDVNSEVEDIDIDVELDSFMETSHPFVEKTIAGDLLSPEVLDPVRMSETLPGVAIPAEHGGQPRQKPSGRAAWVIAGSRTLRRGDGRPPYRPATPKRIYPGCELDVELAQSSREVGR